MEEELQQERARPPPRARSREGCDVREWEMLHDHPADARGQSTTLPSRTHQNKETNINVARVTQLR